MKADNILRCRGCRKMIGMVRLEGIPDATGAEMHDINRIIYRGEMRAMFYCVDCWAEQTQTEDE